MDRIPAKFEASGQGVSGPGRETLPASVAVRCGAAETAAIIRLIEQLGAHDAGPGGRDVRAAERSRYVGLMTDLFQRHPREVLAGLMSPHAHVRVCVALAVAAAPTAQAVPALQQALGLEEREPERRAIVRALVACGAFNAAGQEHP